MFNMSGHKVEFRGPHGDEADDGSDIVVVGEDLARCVILKLSYGESPGDPLQVTWRADGLPDEAVQLYVEAAQSVALAMAAEDAWNAAAEPHGPKD